VGVKYERYEINVSPLNLTVGVKGLNDLVRVTPQTLTPTVM
jgi:hypothetical protein